LVAENKALGVALDEKINENKQITQSLQKMQRESNEFEVEFKKWEKSFEADQKVKVAMIDKLQCEMERLTEQLQ
jgi:cupin superfamily acireductone dioxygenase involved in methionine salvage